MAASVPFDVPRLTARVASIPIASAVTAGAFALLFARPFALLVRDWLSNPEAGHGLLLAPIAVYYAWKAGIDREARPARLLGLAILVAAVLLRYVSALAAELFTMRASMLLAGGGLVIYFVGVRQLVRWWLPVVLLALSVPLPEIVLSRLALPLQFQASRLGAALLEMRSVPVMLTGNVIRIPGHELFVAEACSGLRSLTALVSLAVLVGAMFLRHPVTRVAILAVAIPIAIVVNGVRVFLTAFLVLFVSPAAGTGFMHMTEGWLLFLVALAGLALTAWVAAAIESRLLRPAAEAEVAHA